MKSSRLLLLSSLLLAVALCGCKKDDDSSSLYFNGSIRVPVDRFVEAGYTKTFCVDTLIHVSLEDGSKEGIGYFYRLPMHTVRDTIKTPTGSFTTKTFTIEAPDSLSTFSFSVGAYAEGYYDTTGVGEFTVINTGINGKRTTLTGYDIKETDNTFTDARDGKEYYYTEKGGLQWMRQNLAWEGAGRSFEDCTSAAVSTVFGRYYSWNEAQNVCPEGWRLPSDEDWCKLAVSCGVEAKAGSDIRGFAGKLMENIYFNGFRMWEYWRDVKIDNESGLSAAPFGYATSGDGTTAFAGLDKYAVFWTSSVEEGLGAYRYIYDEKDIFYYGAGDKDYFSASVRCVRDIPEK